MPRFSLRAAACTAAALAAGTTAAAPAQATTVPAMAAAKGTKLRTYSPYDADGEPTVRVTRSRYADSCSGSYVNGQASARRCFSGNNIIDPCFLDPFDEDRAVCVSSPQAKTGIRMRGMSDADDGTGGSSNRRQLWALDLRNGRQCGFLSGATSGRRGMRLNYGCENGAFLWGKPRRNTRFWTILHSKTLNSPLRRKQIAVAWR